MMGTKEKLIERFRSLPTDFTFDEMEKLLGYFGYERSNKGKLLDQGSYSKINWVVLL